MGWNLNMNHNIRPMGQKEAIVISSWKYGGIYSIYDMDGSEEDITELLDGSYYVVKNEKLEIVGYFCFGESAQVLAGNKYNVYFDTEMIDIGLGMNPGFAGQGMGIEFLNKGIEFAKEKFLISKFRLTVAKFNKRAIKTYEKVGFKEVNRFERQQGNEIMEFMVMEYRC